MENYRKFLLEITLKHMNRVGKTDFRVDWGRVLTEYQKYYDDKRNNRELRNKVYSFYTLKQLKEMKAEQLGLKLESPEEKPKAPEVKKKDVITRNSDGSMLYEKLIQLHENEINDDETVLKAFNLSPRVWNITSAEFNLWSVESIEKRLNNYQAKVKVKPKEVNERNITDYIDDLSDIEPFPKITYQINKTSKTYAIFITDKHIGSAVFDNEMFLKTIAKAKHDILINEIEEVRINFLGDILHVDNTAETTVKGTQQKLIMSAYDMVREAERLIIHAITELSVVPSKIYMVTGNHSDLAEWQFFRTVEAKMSNSEHIEFNIDESLQKAYNIYNTFIGIHHGDMAKTNYFKLFQFDFSTIWGKCDLWETHSGHFHEKSTESFGAQIHYRHGTQIRQSSYEHRMGYTKGRRIIEAYIYEKDVGRIQTFEY